MPLEKKIKGVMFGEGTAVEVLVKIKYDQDVWYPATIVENCDDRSFLVEYLTSSEPRKVSVDSSRIRPTPPPLKDRLFNLTEKVDAFNEFGWWCGIIVKALPDTRYSVFFSSSIIEFDQKDVRPQLNWKDGKWWLASSQEELTPCPENTGGHVVSELNDISSGRISESKIISKVEKMEQKSAVSSCQRDSSPRKKLSNDPCTPKGVFVSTNLEKSEFSSSSLGKNQTSLVDLDHPKSHGVASSPKRVKHSSEITTLEEKFKRGGDAVTPSCISSRQNAATSDKQNGDIDSTSGCLPSNTTGENMMIGLTGGDQPSDYPSLRMRTPKKQKKMDGKEIHTLDYRTKPRQAGEECIKGFTKLTSGGKTDVVLKSLGCCNLKGSKAKKTRERLKLEGDQKKQLNDLPVPDQPDAEKSGNMKKRGRPRSVYKRRIKAKVTEHVRKTASHDTIIKDSTISEVDSQVAPESMLMSIEGSLPAENILMPIGNQLNHGNDLGGTIRKSLLRMPIESNEQALITEDELQMPKEAKRRITSENKVVKIPDSSDGTVSMISEPLFITKEVKRTVQQKPGVSNDQPLPMSFEKMHSPINVKTSTPGASLAMTVEQSIELMQTRKDINGQTASGKDNENSAVMNENVHAQDHVCVHSDTMVEHSAKSRQTRKELNEQTPSAEDNEITAVMSDEVDARSCALVDENTSMATTSEPALPFVKSSTLWTVIECMEALRKFPQKPHYRPLQQYKESQRERFAIAYMVTFLDAVEKISKLRFDSVTKKKIDDILDTLNDLEEYGFGVQALRDILAELESIKEQHKKHLEEVDVINKQIVSCSFDKAELVEEINEVTKQMQEVQERIAKVESTRKMTDDEIAVLESRREEAEKAIKGLAVSYVSKL